jgi:ABC-type nitrate/sulfonate/bicarbonate transport system ATPase subunit
MAQGLTMLRLKAIGRQFRGETVNPVLSDIHLDIRPGDFICLLGPSGSGKTTLLRLIAGLDKADHGELDFPGSDMPRMAVVFQEPRLVPWLTVLDNLLLVAGRAAAQDAMEWLRQAELGDVAGRYPGQLSGGMQRRVALVRALLVQPDLLLLDEPLTSLDPALEGRMSDLLCGYWRQFHPAVVMVTHDPRQAAMLATRAIALAKGVAGLMAEETISAPSPGERTAQQCNAIVARLLALCPSLAFLPAPTIDRN